MTRRPVRGVRGFSLVELAFGAAIVVVALGILVFLTVAGTRAFGRGRETLDLIQKTRGVMVRWQRDVRGAVGRVEVDPEGMKLTVEVQQLLSGLEPAVLPEGGFSTQEIVWSYDPSARTLSRGDEVVARDFPDLEFRLFQPEGGAGRPVAPLSVEAVVTSIVGDRPVTLRSLGVPRFMASWAAHPATVYAPLSSPLRFSQQ